MKNHMKNFKKIYFSALVIALLCTSTLTGCSQKPDKLGELQSLTFEHDGVQREYLLYIPESYTESTNLVVALHGIMNTNLNFVETTKLNNVADQYGFVVCYPQALPGFKTKSEWVDYDGWNANLSYSTVDDDGFIDALSDELIAQLHLDNHVYMYGFSIGATMCYHMALYDPEKYVGVASFSGRMSAQDWDQKSVAGNTLVFQTCGTKEPSALNPEENEPYDPTYISKEPVPTLDQIIEFWASTNDCESPKLTTLEDNSKCYEYLNNNGEKRVVYYLFNDMTHRWPSRELFNGTLPSEVAWLFFEENSK